jgi:hypothetical protein
LVFVLFVIAAEISFQHTRILCYPFRHSIILTSGWFCPLPCWQILSRSGTWNACVVSCRITRCSFYFVPFNCDEKEAERFLMALRLHLNKKKQAKVVAKDHQASSSPSSLLSIPSVCLFFPFWIHSGSRLKKTRASKTLSALNGSLHLLSLSLPMTTPLPTPLVCTHANKDDIVFLCHTASPPTTPCPPLS